MLQQRQRTSAKTSSPSCPAPGTSVGGRGNAHDADAIGGTCGVQDPSVFQKDGHDIRHAEPDGEEAFNWARTAAVGVSQNLDVHILHDAKDPIEGASPPTVDDLVIQREPVGYCEPGWETVDRVAGTIESPRIVPKVDTHTLFVDGAPSVDDIHQGQIGDCYFLAALGTVVSSDPGRITKMITLSGDDAVVNFHRYDAEKDTWLPVSIAVPTNLAQTTDADGDDTGLLGSSFRMGKEVKRRAWHADVMRGALAIQADTYYEAGLWVPLMEKAFAVYAEKYGQYGGFDADNANKQTDDDGKAKSGYEVMEGGYAEYVYPMVYGNDVVNTGTTSMEYKVGGNLLDDNVEAIRNLLRVNGDGIGKDEAFDMTCAMDRDEAVERLDHELDHVLKRRDIEQVASFKDELEYLRAIVRGWRSMGNSEKQRAKLGKAAKETVAAGAWPILQSPRFGTDFKDLRDMMLVVANIDTDGNAGQRLTYAWHSYSVLGAEFTDATGSALGITQASLDAQKGSIDPRRSHVRLRNPHGTNEPDPAGKGITDGPDDGAFNLSLETFLRVFSFQEHALVKK